MSGVRYFLPDNRTGMSGPVRWKKITGTGLPVVHYAKRHAHSIAVLYIHSSTRHGTVHIQVGAVQYTEQLQGSGGWLVVKS